MVEKLIKRARRLAYVDENQYNNEQALEDLNIIYHDIENTIISDVREDYFWDYFNTDTVNWQSEYNLPEQLPWNFTSLYKSLWIAVSYNENQEAPTVARRVYPYQLPRDLDWYKENQSATDPIYHISDKSVFIYPAPTKTIEWGLKIYGIQNLKDLELEDEELFNNAIPDKFFHIISLGMLEFIYQQRWMIQEAINANTRYINERAKLVQYIKQRSPSVMQIVVPNLSNLY